MTDNEAAEPITTGKTDAASEPATTPTYRTERPPSRKNWRLRLIAYPLIIVAALWWATQDNTVQFVGPTIYNQSLAVLSEHHAGKGLALEQTTLSTLPPGHAVLIWWNGGPALSYASDTTLSSEVLQRWRLGLKPADLPEISVQGEPLTSLWLELPLVPWPQGWKVLLRDDH